MDHRKLLVIILSVAVFVALVLGIALLAYYPGDEPVQEARNNRGDFDPIEYVRSGEDSETDLDEQDSDDTDDDDLVIIYGSRQADDVEDPDRSASDAELDTRAEDSRRVDPLADPEPRAPAVRGGTRDGREVQDAQTPGTGESDTSRDSVESGGGEQSVAVSTDRTAAQEASTRTVPQDDGGPTREFWIQVISSSSRDTAESARERLASRDFGSVIFPVSVGGDNYYRVRVGPYDNRNEAQKFLSWIQDLDGFEQSYVSLVTRS